MHIKKQSVLLVMVVLLATCGWAAAYSGGTGEPNDPYIIATAEDMNAIGANLDDLDAHFLLVADINLADYTGTQFNIIGSDINPFTGVFDGNDHTISNFTYTAGTSFIGLFCCVGEGGQIKNLGMENVDVNVTNGFAFGGLAGDNGGTITNCYVTGTVSGVFFVGGLVGGNSGTISNSYATATVSGNGFIGGLAGGNSGTISNCYVTGPVNGDYTGGLVGYNFGTISNCNATGNISGYENIGGLVGENNGEGTISGCNATGAVNGNHYTGGLVGGNGTEYSYYGGTISDCYATGDINGNYYTGGLVGVNNDNGTVSNSYSTGSISAGDYTGGLVGRNYATITNCYSTGGVSGDFQGIGGLVGDNDANGTISNCYATGSVLGDFQDIGGLVGGNEGTITNCSSTGNVTGRHDTGGLAGYNYGPISNCYTTASVSGDYEVGGLVGTIYPATISNCYAAGAVEGHGNIGGLVGFVDSATIYNCYAVGAVDGNVYAGSLIGYDHYHNGSYTSCFWDSDVNPHVNGIGNSTDPNVIGESTSNMQTESTFTSAGWDFIDVWDIGENQTYPFLRFYPAGDINHDGIVNFYDLAILAGRWLQGTE